LVFNKYKIKNMNMKRILNVAMLLIIAIVVGSCKKDITLTPTSGVLISDYFKTQNDITASLAGIYSAFQEEMEGAGTTSDEGLGGRYHYWGDLRGETFLSSTFTSNSAIELSRNTLEFANSFTDWGGLYKVISRTNLAIQYYPQVLGQDPNVTQTILNNSLAQAYAMRAESYFYIVRLWGDAPMWTTPYLDITTSGSKASTKAITLIDSLIIPDLTKAYALIQKNQTPTVWYVGEGAICSILADVYMWRAAMAGGGGATDYQNAITWYKNLFLAKGPTGVLYGAAGAFETTANWKNIFINPTQSPEPIWSINWDYTVNGCACIPVFVGLTNNPVQLDPAFQAFWKKQYKTDTRVAKSIDTLATLNHINLLYKYYNLIPNATGITPVAGNLNFNVYLPMYRLGDAYLSYAEASAQTGDLATALTYLNLIHKRASSTGATFTASQFPTSASMIDGILAEDQLELLGEGKRWFELVRTNRVHTIMDPILNLRNGTVDPITKIVTLATTGFIDAPNRYLWPISQSALNANTLLKQNPGY
jgi:tetratricopeptide (TPR) repeat protein